MRSCLGISVGAARLVAAPSGQRPTVRRTVVTLFGHRPPEVGVPSENPRLTDPGLVLADFTDRVGDPVPIVAADGSSHRGERLAAAAVDGLIRSATRHRPEAVTVAVPGYWSARSIDALQRELPGMTVVTDDVAALTALQAHPGLPARGVIVLCDFGATGTSITLADAGAGFRRIGDTVRYPEFSGDLIDQALLRHVLSGLETDPTGTSAVTALGRLRENCRLAKERLSGVTATGVPVSGSTVRVTRAELEPLLTGPVDGFLAVLLELLHRNNIAPAEVAALATVGGGARIPFVTERISRSMRLPVTTTEQAGVVAAIGAGLIAERGLEHQTATVVVPPVQSPSEAATASAPVVSALAWSAEPAADEAYDEMVARPDVQFIADEVHDATELPPLPGYRRPGVLFGAAASVAAVAAVTLVLTSDADGASVVAESDTAISVVPQPVELPSPPPPPPAPAPDAPPAPATVVNPPPAAAPVTQVPVNRPQEAVRIPAAGTVSPPAAPPPAPVAPPPAPVPSPPGVVPLPVVIPLPILPPPAVPPPTTEPPPTSEPPTSEPPTTEPPPTSEPPTTEPPADSGDSECVPTAEASC